VRQTNEATMKASPGMLLDALVQHLRGCTSSPDGIAMPAAILWTDPDGQWLPLIPALQRVMPELLTHGTFDPAERTGPAIWLRCVVDRTVSPPSLPANAVPIIYLPRTSRQALTTGEECPRELQPLVELMFRGALWLQKGGHDWTITAFLTSPQGLGLDLARDAATKAALHNALREVAVAPLAQLRRGRLEARDFDQMLSSDVTRDMLRWMGDAEAQKNQMGAERWTAFCGRSREQFDFDPEKGGAVKAGELMGKAEGPWAEVWARFEEAPSACPGIPELLRRCRPSMLEVSHWPQRNDKEEQALGAALSDLEGAQHAQICARLIELERVHAQRRQWVWARLGQSPFAVALERLAVLATAAQQPLGGSTPDEIARTYTNGLWRADAGSWQALATIPVQHEEAVRRVVQLLLEPWLADSAKAFQAAVGRAPMLGHRKRETVEPEPGGCLMFVDGLRYDLGRILGERLEGQGCRVDVRQRWAALPTVTATGKPAVTPVAAEITGERFGEDFGPSFRGGRSVDAAGLRNAVAAKGYQVIAGDAGDWPLVQDARGFVEYGDIDTLGHERQDSLPRQIEEQLERLAARTTRLLEAGWTSVRIVTDHGWLYLPEGLPKVDLPKHLTLSRWARCAVIAGESSVDVPRVTWHWNSMESAAVAPGISCFNQSPCYAHGGLSIQECLTPDLLVVRGGERRSRATIKAVTWRGMRCLVEAETGGGEVRADLRLDTANGTSVVKAAKVLEADGSTSLVVADDRHESAALVLVLLAADHTILAQQDTRVGATS
jgi:hypothetical protein